jgi:hypothetical protein
MKTVLIKMRILGWFYENRSDKNEDFGVVLGKPS